MRSVIIRQNLAVPMFDFGCDLDFSGSYGLGTKASIKESISHPQYTAFKLNAPSVEALFSPDLLKLTLPMIIIYPNFSVDAYFHQM